MLAKYGYTAVLCSLLVAGCSDDEAEQAAHTPVPRAPEIRLTYAEARVHKPGRGMLRVTARDADGDLLVIGLLTVNPSHTLETDYLSVASVFRLRISL